MPGHDVLDSALPSFVKTKATLACENLNNESLLLAVGYSTGKQ